MSKYYGYPPYTPDGVQIVTTTDGYYKDSLMNTTVYHMEKGDKRHFFMAEEEQAFLLIEGDVTFKWEGKSEHAVRKTCFDDGKEAVCLHVCKGVEVDVEAGGPTELFVASTENERIFDSIYYPTKDIREVISCPDICEGYCERKVTTIFDDNTAPYSNLVLGEIFPLQGRWCGYPPHSHPQPEVYYYRIDKPEGFGACFVGDEVFKITDRSFSCLTHGASHPQACAPGYHMYIIWIIRHLPDDMWSRGPNLPEYQWLENEKY